MNASGAVARPGQVVLANCRECEKPFEIESVTDLEEFERHERSCGFAEFQRRLRGARQVGLLDPIEGQEVSNAD